MALKNYSSTSLTGGGSGALDSIDGTNLTDLDSALVFTADTFYFYILDDDSAAAESSPDVIAMDANGGNKRWILIFSMGTSGTITLSNTGLHLLDTGGNHDLIIKPGSDVTADRTLTLTTGDSDRTITLSGNPTLADWFDQAVKAASSPTFANATITTILTLANSGLHVLDTNASHDLIITPGSDLTADRILTITTGDAARTIALSGDTTLADWFDQAVKAASSPTFAGLSLTADLAVTEGGTGASDAAGAKTNLGFMTDVSDDTTPQLGGELDCQAHSVGFTLQTATGDGTTTIDWRLGNKFKFTFGAANETFTFTAPTKPCNLMLILIQDGVGSRTATWPGTVKWAERTAPTLTTTGAYIDIVSFFWDGANFYGQAGLNFG